MFGTYERLNVPVWATSREVIKAASLKLKPAVRFSPQHRDARHRFYLTMLEYHDKARDIYKMVAC